MRWESKLSHDSSFGVRIYASRECETNADRRGGEILTYMKYIIQFLYYIGEVALFIILCLCISSYISNQDVFDWINTINSMEFIEKITVMYVFYQICVFAILSLIDSARKDAILSKIKLINLGIVRFEHNQLFQDKEINVIESSYLHDNRLFVNKEDKGDIIEFLDVYKKYNSKEISENDYSFYLQNKLVNLQHEYEYLALEWRLSFLLRKLK